MQTHSSKESKLLHFKFKRLKFRKIIRIIRFIKVNIFYIIQFVNFIADALIISFANRSIFKNYLSFLPTPSFYFFCIILF